jgi:hypothetical protein
LEAGGRSTCFSEKLIKFQFHDCAEQIRGADQSSLLRASPRHSGEKIAVLRKVRIGSKFILAAAHAHVRRTHMMDHNRMISATHRLATEYGQKLIKQLLGCAIIWFVASMVLTLGYPELLDYLHIPHIIAVIFLLFTLFFIVYRIWKNNFRCLSCGKKIGSPQKRDSIYETYKYYCKSCNIVWDTKVNHHGT